MLFLSKGVIRMPRKPPADLDEQIIGQVGNNPSGMGVEQLLRLFQGEVTRRTLQRRLSALVKSGRLITQGGGPSTVYLLPKRGDLKGKYLPLSPSGAEVRRLVRRSQSERTPVSYQREFLDQYRPNESANSFRTYRTYNEEACRRSIVRW